MTESQLQAAVIDLCRRLGYLVAHFRPATLGGRWVTPVQGDGAGFPDLVVAGRGRVLFVELKAAKGRVSDAQTAWLLALEPAAETHVWRPADWLDGTVERTLRRRPG